MNLIIITDLSNREIIGWSVGQNKTSELVYQAFVSIHTDLRKIRYFHGDWIKNQAGIKRV